MRNLEISMLGQVQLAFPLQTRLVLFLFLFPFIRLFIRFPPFSTFPF